MLKNNSLWGRQSEIDALSEILNCVKPGNATAVLISGEAGMGKSFLSEYFINQNRLTYNTGRAVENAPTPYGIVASILREFIRDKGSDVLDFGPLAKYLGYVLPEFECAEEPVEQEIIIETISTALNYICNDKPHIFFLDDLHYADDTSLEILPDVIDRLKNKPILFLATYRNDELPRGHQFRKLKNELRRRRLLNEIVLESLDKRSTKEIIQSIIGYVPTDSFAEQVHNHSQGVPLFTEEIAQTLLHKSLFKLNKQNHAYLTGENLPIPESIKDTVLLRTASLSPEAMEILELAAIAGTVFNIDIIDSILGSEDGIDELFEQNFLVESRQDKAAFKHALIRDAVRDEITWTKRRRLNKQVAEYYEKKNYPSEIIAEQWLAANNIIKARTYFLQSADNSCSVHAYRDASNSAFKALEIWTDGEDQDKRIDTLLKLAHCTKLSGQLNESIKALKEIVDIANEENNKSILAETYRSIATIYALQSSWDLSIKYRLLSAEEFEARSNYSDAAAEYLAAAARYTGLLQLNSAVELSVLSVESAMNADRHDIIARALGLKGNILAMQGKFDEGKQTAQKALSIALEHNQTEAASEVYRRLASTMDYASDYASAKEAYKTAYNYCVNTGSDVYAQICLSCMSYVLFQTGDWKQSLEVCRDVINSKDSPEGSKLTAYGIAGIIYAFRGEVRKAGEYLDIALDLSYKYDSSILVFFASWGLSIIAENENNIEELEKHYNRALNSWPDSQDRHDIIPILLWAAAFFADNNHNKELTLCADALSKIASDTGNPEALSCLAAVLGEIAGYVRRLFKCHKAFRTGIDSPE